MDRVEPLRYDKCVPTSCLGYQHRGSAGIVGKVQGVAANGHLAQAAAIVNVVVGRGTIGPLGSQAVRVIGVRPGGGAVGHGHQFPAMLPDVGPGAVGEHIANGIAGNRLAVVACQQVAPGGIAIGIGNRINNRAKRSDGVGILLAAGDVAPVVVGPDPGLARRLAIFPGQLVSWAAGFFSLPWNPKIPGPPLYSLIRRSIAGNDLLDQHRKRCYCKMGILLSRF